jgi:glycosyltransferase involved in cell wall biosynthesis
VNSTEIATNVAVSIQGQRQANDEFMPSPAKVRPRILFIVDCPGWAHDFKTRNLARVLANDYDIRKRYQTEVTPDDLDQADLILVYFWLQFKTLQALIPCFKHNLHKLLVGVCSHWELERGWRRAGLKMLRKLSRAVFVNNLALYHEFQPLLNRLVFLTPNGVDTSFFSPAVRIERSAAFRIGWAGSLSNRDPGYRGYHDLIVPAVAALEGVELVTAAREEKWRGPEEMREFYRSLDVYVCASRTEGTPNPCLEAAACGVPLLTTRVGNMPELVRDGVNGFFIERDTADIAEKLRLLRDDAALRTSLAHHIREDIQGWDWSIRAQAYKQMFEEVLSRKT